MLASSLALATSLSARWIESGHFPLSNMYESLLFLGWGVTAIHFWIANAFPLSALAGALTSPLALCVTGGATFLLPAELQRASALVPSLQSNWLMMHVSVMMMSYATLLVGSLVAGAFLVLTAPEDGFVGASRKAVTDTFAKLRGDEKAEPVTSAEPPVVETAPAVVATAAEPVTPIGQVNASQADPWGDILAGNVVTIAGAQEGASTSPSRSVSETCNELAYQCSCLGFAFLTFGLTSGAVWANESWGSYWSWDPKETWALIVWLVYAGYLHTRLSPQYTERFSNAVCFAGFVATWICYVGVNLFAVGLHSYGWFAGPPA
jgi:cytochrome c-type biogenesis protein CcsB